MYKHNRSHPKHIVPVIVHQQLHHSTMTLDHTQQALKQGIAWLEGHSGGLDRQKKSELERVVADFKNSHKELFVKSKQRKKTDLTTELASSGFDLLSTSRPNPSIPRKASSSRASKPMERKTNCSDSESREKCTKDGDPSRFCKSERGNDSPCSESIPIKSTPRERISPSKDGTERTVVPASSSSCSAPPADPKKSHVSDGAPNSRPADGARSCSSSSSSEVEKREPHECTNLDVWRGECLKIRSHASDRCRASTDSRSSHNLESPTSAVHAYRLTMEASKFRTPSTSTSNAKVCISFESRQHRRSPLPKPSTLPPPPFALANRGQSRRYSSDPCHGGRNSGPPKRLSSTSTIDSSLTDEASKFMEEASKGHPRRRIRRVADIKECTLSALII